MKAFFVIVLILASLPLHSALIGIGEGGSVLEADGMHIAINAGEAYITAGPYSHGTIDRKGLIAAADDPHGGNLSLSPRITRPGREGERSGSLLSLGPVKIAASSDGRPFLSFSYDSGTFALALLFAFQGEEDDSFHRDPGRSGEWNVLYLGCQGAWGPLSLTGMISFAEEIGFRGVISGTIGKEGYSLSFAYGSLIALYSDSPEYSWSLAASLEEEGFRAAMRIAAGEEPVFSEDYLPYETELSSVLDFGSLRIFSHMEHGFSRSGNVSRSDFIGAACGIMTLWYSSSDGAGFSVDAGHFSFGWREGHAFVSFRLTLDAESVSLIAEASTDRGVEASLIITL